LKRQAIWRDYERDLGSGSPLKLPRGKNNLREHGGAITALALQIDAENFFISLLTVSEMRR